MLNSPSPPPRPAGWNRYLLTTVSGLVIIGTIVSVWVFKFSRDTDLRRIEAEFVRRADSRYALTSQIIAYYESGLYALKSLFEGSNRVSREEFHEIAVDVLARHPGIAALEWVPVVQSADRKSVEARIAGELGRPFEFVDRTADGTRVPAAERAEYLPILYVEPLAGNEPALGLDVQTVATRWHLEEARRTRKFTATGRFQLVQGGTGVVMAWPVFMRAPGELTERICRGFVQGVFRVEEILQHAELRSPSTALDELYVDASASAGSDRILYFRFGDRAATDPASLTEDDIRRGIHRDYSIEFGGRQWKALYRPTDAWIAAERSYEPFVWLIAGLVMTGLLAALVASMARRTASIQRQVDLRTAELSESRRQLSSLLHALPGMAFRLGFDPQWTVLFVSEGALPLTGYRMDELIGRVVQFRRVVHPDDLERLETVMREALDHRREIEVEFRIRPPVGPEKWVLARGRGVFFGDDGKPLFLEGLALDITTRKLAETDKMIMERRLLESQKLESLGLLAGGIAHDFNNILTGITGHASLARYSPAAESADHLHKIEAAVSRAAELCQQMLAFSGRGHFVIEPVDLNQIVRETLPLLQGSVPTRARLDLVLSPKPVFVMGDATQLRQIAMNLILNAGESLPPTSGRVTVTTGVRRIDREFLSAARLGENLASGEYVFLEVRDTGCGMTADTLAKIFDPFFTTKFTGRGLGLAAVLGIVRGHVGALHVASEFGHGSVFTLILPPATGVSATPGEAAAAPAWRRSGRALVIDDEAPVREIAAQLLESFGFTVQTADGGADGLRQFRAESAAFDLVFLDLTMPGIDGVETLAGLRALDPNVRVLLVSGYSETENIAQLGANGSLVFLQKPFSRERLEQKLRTLLG